MDRLSLPNGSTAVNVGIIDRQALPPPNTSTLYLQSQHCPPDAPSYAFAIAHPSGRSLLFDLGLRKDWWSLTPSTAHFLQTSGWKLEASQNVSEILQANGQTLAAIEAVIWSHHHFDHVGDISPFPKSTKIIIGPGFTHHYVPGYPTNPSSTLLEAQWQDRELHELSFQNAPPLKIGSFDAIDYFGDASFYLLHAPGHTFGHLAALARVTADPDNPSANSFVFMGADTCHFSAQFRPSPGRPMLLPAGAEYTPAAFESGADSDTSASAASATATATASTTCPGAILERLLAQPTTPLFTMPASNTVDANEAQASIRGMQAFDAAENVWVVIAHDQALLGVVDFYPASVNDWREKGYGEKTRWRFWNTLRRRTSETKLA
ncbi:beta-lactamase-like protein [Aspergillus heterothallicus]